MPARRRKRKPSQKEPVGKTKSELLLYVVDNPKASLTDIRGFLRNDMNIRNVKVVRKHLSDLSRNNLIQRLKANRGLSDQYFIEESFSSFHSAFDYLRENYEPIGLLKTKYFQKVKSEDDFFLYGIVNILKILFVDVMDILSDDKRYEELLHEAEKEESLKESIQMFIKQREKFLKQNEIEVVSSLKNKKPEEMFGANIKIILNGLLNQLILEDQKEEIINIISTSPSAMDYFLNLRTENMMMFFSVLIRFFLGALFIDPSKVDSLISFNNIKQEEIDTKDVSNLLNTLANMKDIVNDNPILTTLKAHFILDAVNGKVIENEYSTKTLSNILIPKVKS